jgi:sugar/nucleoside kinase (ribokinase family)
MNKKNTIKKTPTCVGAGLVALDVIMNGNPEAPVKIFAGGSCGNVLSILSFLGWTSLPIARLKKDVASDKLLADLKKWKVKTTLVSTTEDGSTPIIIQRIKEDKLGNLTHRFEFRNPDNGEWLPRYKPVLSADVPEFTGKQGKAEVFYFDRVNRAALDLATFYKEKGATIFFEPSSFSEEKQFEEALSIADIIKFSGERIGDYAKRFPIQKASLEIETLGENGVRFRFGLDKKTKNWKSVPTYKISHFMDAAGAGDWTSAGIISSLCANGANGFKKVSEKKVISAIKYGQALGAANCLFDGARGIMYNLPKTRIDALINLLQQSKKPVPAQKVKKIKYKNVSISDLY